MIKRRLISITVCLLIIIMIVSAAVPTAMALTKQEQEDVYRVGTMWQADYIQDYIGWLLDSDNFVYHLDCTEGFILDHQILALNPAKRTDVYVKYLAAIIEIVNTKLMDVAREEVTSSAFTELCESFAEYVLLASDTYDVAKDIADILSEIKLQQLDPVLMSYTLELILFNSIDAEKYAIYGEVIEKLFKEYLASAKFASFLDKFSGVVNGLTTLINAGEHMLDLIVEAKAYTLANEYNSQMIKYIYNNASDPLLKAACQEVYVKIHQEYNANLSLAIIDTFANVATTSITKALISDIISDCNLSVKCAKLGYDLGVIVSNLLLNTKDTVEHMRSIYCINEISECIVKQVSADMVEINLYDKESPWFAEFAASMKYHVKTLVELRRLGEEKYFKLKESVYASALLATIHGLSFNTIFSKPITTIDDWYEEFTLAINTVDYHMFKEISPSLYYEMPTSSFTSEDGVLLYYYGNKDRFVLDSFHSYIHTINSYAFSENEHLDSVSLGKSITLIKSHAFYSCENLSYVTVENPEAVIAADAFVGYDSDFTLCGYEGSTAEAYALANGIPFLSIGNPYDTEMRYPEGLVLDYFDVFPQEAYVVGYTGDATELYIPYGIVGIGYGAFEGNTTLTKVILPDTVEFISEKAFKGCTSLEEINIPKSLTMLDSGAFEGCSSLREISVDKDNEYYAELGNCVISYESTMIVQGCSTSVLEPYDYIYSIGPKAFAGIPLPENLVIPEGIEFISESAFEGCTTVKSLTLPSSLIEIEDNAFAGCTSLTSVTVKHGTTDIGAGAFSGCSSLSKVSLPASVTSLGYGVFKGCARLSELTTPACFSDFDDLFARASYPMIEELTLIGNADVQEKAFYICNYVRNVNISGGIKNVGDKAFARCDSLVSVTVGDSVVSLGKNVFSECKALSEIYVGAGVKDLPEHFVSYTPVTTVELSEGLKTVGPAAFAGCESLVSIVLPDSLVGIGGIAFTGCSSLENINLPEGILSFGYEAFHSCTSLKSLVIPESANDFGTSAFGYLHDDAYSYLGGAKYIGTASNPYLLLVSLVDNAESITVADGTEYISHYAFMDSTMTEIHLPSSIKVIYERAFHCCDYLSTVYYEGTAEEWTRIEIGEYNSALLLAALVCHEHSYVGCEPTASGTHVRYCECGDTVEEAHLPDKITHVSEYTCTEDGYAYIACALCGTVLEEFVTPAAHDFAEEYTKDRDRDCTVDGEMSRHCTRCDERTDITKIPASHSWSAEITTDRDATCTVDGETSRHCTRCDERTDITKIPASHVWDTELTVDKAPTYTEPGSQSRHCLVCDERKDVEDIPCLIPEGSADDFYYIAFSDHVEICEYIGTSEDMFIPAYIDGLPVTHIKAFAFYQNSVIKTAHIPSTVTTIEFYAFCYCENLVSITISEGITEIPDSIFDSCTGLTEVNLPGSVRSIGNNAFYGCSSLTEIVIPEGVRTIGEQAFYSCTSLMSITFPSTLQRLGNDAVDNTLWFNYLSEPATVVGDGVLVKMNVAFGADLYIPEGVKTISCISYETIDSHYLNTVYIPSTLTEWDQYALKIRALSYVVDSASTAFTSEYGILYSKDMKTLVAYPSRSSGGECVLYSSVERIGDGAFYNCEFTKVTLLNGVYEIGAYAFYSASSMSVIVLPDSISKIGEGAFMSCDALTNITLPRSLTEIPYNAFFSCQSLKSVTLYNGVKTIGTSAFYGCTSLERINFIGTEEEWQAIDVGYSNTTLDNVTVTFLSSVHSHGYTTAEPNDNHQHKLVCECGEYIFKDHLPVYNGCDENGVCKICGYSEIDPLGHSFTVYVPNNDATYTEDGTKTSHCDICGEESTVADVGSMLGYERKFRDETSALTVTKSPDDYYALYSAMLTYSQLTEEEREAVAEEYARLLVLIKEYNEVAKEVNETVEESSEISLAPLSVIGFSFVTALWFFIKRKLFM